MTDDRDITERLEAVAGFGGTHLDGIWSDAANEIKALRYYVTLLEDQRAKAETDLDKAQDHISKQALDIVELGQEVGRLREERPQIDYVIDSHGVTHRSFTLVYKTRAALAKHGEK